jgi:hypothetical protein
MSCVFWPWFARLAGRSAGMTILLVVLGSVLGSCAASSPPTVLSGTVIDAYTGQPIEAAAVTVGDTSLNTDNVGAFQTERWNTDDTLAISAPSYEALELDLATRPDLAESDALTVTLATELRPNTLSGTITDAFTAAPLAGAELALTVDVSTTLTAVSDAEGVYRFEGVPEAFTLQITAPDYADATTDLTRTVAHDVVLRPNTLSGTIIDRFTGEGVAGATVQVGDQQATTAEDGSYRIADIPEGVDTVEIRAERYATLSLELGRTTSLDATLRPDTLIGTLVNATSGDPIANAAIYASTSRDGTDIAFTRMIGSAEGQFTLEGIPEQGYLHVLAPGYRKAVFEIQPGNIPETISMEPFKARAIYITAAVASSPALVEEFVALIEQTDLNAIVIDLKSDLRDDLGLLYYDSQVPLAQELDLSAPYIDMPALVQDLRDRGIYTIARIQLFSHDNVLADARPEWAITRKDNGEVYADYPGPGIRYAYLDPTNRNVWDYNIQIGVEAARMGFDEINYDYIRFPDWYGDYAEFTETLAFSEPIDPVNNPARMFEVITEFMDEAHRAVNGAGAYMSVDVFGRVVQGGSLTIAQDIGLMGNHTDFICPMPYPSLWWPGAFGIESPVEEPYAVLSASVEAGVAQIEGEYALLRPWLQDHTDPWAYRVVEYGPAEVLAQIRATEEHPAASGWMLYDSANRYVGAFNGAVGPIE